MTNFCLNGLDSVRELDSRRVTSNILQDVCVSIITEHMIYQTIYSIRKAIKMVSFAKGNYVIYMISQGVLMGNFCRIYVLL